MKTKHLLIGFILLLLSLMGCGESGQQVTEPPVLSTSSTEETTYGALGALSDSEYSIEEMLTYAIQDEYLAKAEYELILSEFDITNPFSNIVESEKTHIALLLPLFDAYSITPLEDTAAEHIILPTTLKEVFETGVQAEINNIAMYDRFLDQDLPDDLRDAFTSLRDASKNHLKAFETNLEKYN